MPFATRGDTKLHYIDQGAGPAVVLLMGFAHDHTAWVRQMPALAPHYRTIAIDNRGVGQSSKPGGAYTIAEMADDALAVIEAAGEQRAHLVGLSMGGMIAQEMALRAPARVRSLVLAATFAAPNAELRERFVRTRELFGRGEGAFPFAEVFRTLTPLLLSEAFMEREYEMLVQMTQQMMSWFDPKGFFGQSEAIAGHDTTARLQKLKVPTLVMLGENDRLVPPEQSRALWAAIPGARLECLAGAPHAFQLECADRFNELMLGFLAGVA
jgi:pimeloyl-ACP methyl ester carboxylesterase